MSQTRYVADLLGLTKEGYCELTSYAEARERAQKAGRPAASAADGRFDQLSTDLLEHFKHTIGVHRTLVAIVKAMPASKDETVKTVKRAAKHFLKDAVHDFEFMSRRFYDMSLRSNRRGNSEADVIASIHARMSAAYGMRNVLLFTIDQAAPSNEPAMILLKYGVRAALARAVEDYALLVDQFKDFAEGLGTALNGHQIVVDVSGSYDRWTAYETVSMAA